MITQSRIDFELFVSGRGFPKSRYYDEYYSRDVQLMWIGWSARDTEILALSAKLAADKGE